MRWNRSSKQSVLGLMVGLLALGCRADMVVGDGKGVERERTKAGQAQTQEQSTDQSGWSVKRADQAVARARSLLGVRNSTKFPAIAELVTLETDNTPFLSEQLIGRPLWHVTLTGCTVDVKSVPLGVKDGYDRVFDVYLDPLNGRLLKVVSRWPDGVPPIKPEPSAASAARQMRQCGREEYHGFPKDPPAVSFMDALDIIYDKGVGSPLEAKQIVAHYVMRSRMFESPRAVWAITLRGITPFPAAYPGVSVDARNHLRNIVDAQTGKWLGAGTSPQPE